MDPENEQPTESATPAEGAAPENTAPENPEAVAESAEGILEPEAPILPAQEVRAIMEALIFCSPQPITSRDITAVMQGVPK
jgi:hypothetical protein